MFENEATDLKAPSHVTISGWVKKVGIYHLEKSKPKKSNDWIIIIDESIEFGNEKMLLILGIQQKNIDFTRSLNYQDVRPLILKISNSWKGEDISREIEALKKRIGGIKYAVADMGNGIQKGLKLSNVPHVADLTHKISWIIKQLYEKDETFVAYTKASAKLRGSLPLSKIAYILPPSQRVHSRFMNLKPIVDWGNSVVKLMNGDEELDLEREKLEFLNVYEEFLKEISSIVEISIQIQKILKNNGLSKKTLIKCKQLFKNVPKHAKLNDFKEMIIEYLEEVLSLVNRPRGGKLLCTSDIIESSFGKYKNYIHSSPSIGITDLCLSIPAFTFDYKNEEKLIKAMEEIKHENIVDWKSKEIGKTLLARRKKVIDKKKEGGKKK